MEGCLQEAEQCDHIVGEGVINRFAFLWFEACVLSVRHGLFAVPLVSLIGHVL